LIQIIGLQLSVDPYGEFKPADHQHKIEQVDDLRTELDILSSAIDDHVNFFSGHLTQDQKDHFTNTIIHVTEQDRARWDRGGSGGGGSTVIGRFKLWPTFLQSCRCKNINR
jgi:hypothetical protein